MSKTQNTYPYIVKRLMAAAYCREDVMLLTYDEFSRIINPSVLNDFLYIVSEEKPDRNEPFSNKLIEQLKQSTLARVRKDNFRRCIILSKTECIYVERNGSFNVSMPVPSGGINIDTVTITDYA